MQSIFYAASPAKDNGDPVTEQDQALRGDLSRMLDMSKKDSVTHKLSEAFTCERRQTRRPVSSTWVRS